MYAIARIEKIKNLEHVQAATDHNMRTVPRFSREVDQSRSYLNLVLIGSKNAYSDIEKALPYKRRKNAVLAIEVLLTASPQYFRGNAEYGKWDTVKLESWKSSAFDFAQKHWGENLVNCVLHLDEATPHLQMFIVPKREDGKLDARSLFNREALFRLQDEYHKAVKHLGLRRGIQAALTGRKHEKLKDYYNRVNQPVYEVELDNLNEYEPLQTLKPSLFGTVDAKKANELIVEAQKRINAQQLAHKELLEKAFSLAELARALDNEKKLMKRLFDGSHHVTERTKKALDDEIKKNQELNEQLQEISLEEALDRLGSIQNNNDKFKWHTELGTIMIGNNHNEQIFFSFENPSISGNNAINLVSIIMQVNSNVATAWLSSCY